MAPEVALPSPNQLDIYPDDPEEFVRAYLEVWSKADYEGMKRFAADEITMLAGSTLLDERYGGLGGEDGREANQPVTEDEWIAGYERAIERLGGRQDYIDGLSGFAQETTIMVIQNGVMGFREASEKNDLQPDDVICIVNPEGDSGAVVICRGDSNRWYVIAEFWD